MSSTKEALNNSSALKVNLQNTAAEVQIPEKYEPLLKSVESYFGVYKRVKELLTELNHPFVNWNYVAEGLKTFSVNDFSKFNNHENAPEAIKTVFDIYFDIVSSNAKDDIKDKTIRYLFDFISTLLSESRENIDRNVSYLSGVFGKLIEISEKNGAMLRKCSYFVKPLLRHSKSAVLKQVPEFLKLASSSFKQTYLYWLNVEDPENWFNKESKAGLTNTSDEAEKERIKRLKDIVSDISHSNLKKMSDKIDSFDLSANASETVFAELAQILDYNQILNAYLEKADLIEQETAFGGLSFVIKLDFLFNIISASYLSEIHTQAFQEINRSLSRAFVNVKPEQRADFIKKIFRILRDCCGEKKFAGLLLNAMLTIAHEVVPLEDRPLLNVLIDEIIATGFQYPEAKGSNVDWQVQMNPEHIHNIRVWMEIIEMKPEWTHKLLSALIINLKVGGVLIRDTDLFQRDISKYLNAGIYSSINLSKQLLRQFPAFFNEIGAEGELRETSTRADELGTRHDILVHFIRKVAHVESNNLLTKFIDGAFHYWFDGSKEHIKNFVPEEILNQISNDSEYYEGMHKSFVALFELAEGDTSNFLNFTPEQIKEKVKTADCLERDHERAFCMVRLFQLLTKKYNPQPLELANDLKQANIFEPERIAAFEKHLAKHEVKETLTCVLDFIAQLQGRVLSSEQTTAVENIYYKRHIAVGIPSMYGVYKEKKFDSLSLALRLESLGTMLLEEIVQDLGLTFITKSTITKIHECLPFFVKALALEGLPTRQLSTKINMLKLGMGIKLFSIDQYLDLFLAISKAIQNIIKDYYVDAHRTCFPIVVKQMIAHGHESVKGADPEDRAVIFKLQENFLRSLLSSAFGLQVLDNFISKTIDTLQAELEKFRDQKAMLNLVVTYNPDLTVTHIYDDTPAIDNQIMLGNKGYWLKRMASFGFPVPKGFILTTEVFRCLEAVTGYKSILDDLHHRINGAIHKLERSTGRKFGNTERPLLLSVRSGAAISMPGMMDTFLNVGINKDICESLSKKPGFEWAAWDCYRRFLQSWGMNEGLDRNFFDHIINNFKTRFNVTKKLLFSPTQMKEIALTYRDEIQKQGITIFDKPEDQLKYAIMQTFASWNSNRAKVYRKQMNISDEWGTAVTIMSMIFGNLNEEAGSGVTFTRDPNGQSRELQLFGDFFFGVQGDDIVSGLIETYPISEAQRIKEKRNSDISLESHFPKVYKKLYDLAETLIKQKGFSAQEIEFTFENSTENGLYILQTRDQYQEKESLDLPFKATPELEKSYVGNGVGVSGGALAGRVVFSEEEINKWRELEPYNPLILIRPDTVPEDVSLLLHVEGLLTARGGRTSHAAVTIPQLKKVGVVGFSKLKVYERDSYCFIGDHRLKSGDYLSIDGRSGSVYLGLHQPEDQ
ncbi:MAG: hypothetical protein II961_10210 [Candidatus Riflebacteria bacterium]|nr:hypothetical protein [Candidatus Riflebacteria bacterium]